MLQETLEMLIGRDMKKKDLRLKTGISTTTLAKLGKDENVGKDILAKICAALICDVGDIMEFLPENKKKIGADFGKNKVRVTANVTKTKRGVSMIIEEILVKMVSKKCLKKEGASRNTVYVINTESLGTKRI